MNVRPAAPDVRWGEQRSRRRGRRRGAGARAEYWVTDVTEENAVRRASKEVGDVFGGIDVWVNNAGVTLFAPRRRGPLTWRRRRAARTDTCTGSGRPGSAPPRFSLWAVRRFAEIQADTMRRSLSGDRAPSYIHARRPDIAVDGTRGGELVSPH